MNSEEGGAMMEFLIFVAVAFSLHVLVLGLLQLVAPQSSLHEGVRRRLAQFKACPDQPLKSSRDPPTSFWRG